MTKLDWASGIILVTKRWYQSREFMKMQNAASPVRLLAISGSLRAGSSNTILLRVASRLAPAGIEMTVYDNLGELPHFNPDLEGAEPPVVKDFRTQVGAADGLVISTPEYAHGLPGVLKNALDWLVGGVDFMNKPVVFFNASLRSTYALASLTEIVTVMSGRIITEAAINVPLQELQVDEEGIVAHVELRGTIQTALRRFGQAITRERATRALDE